MTKKTFTVTAPDGQVFTRTSKTRDYKFAILVRGGELDRAYKQRALQETFDYPGMEIYREKRQQELDEHDPNAWGYLGFSGDRKNAEKTADQWRKKLLWDEVIVVPVD
jgi:hypothetical protein